MIFAAPDILCIGAVLWDIIGRTPAAMAPGEDLPGRITRAPGGVALNIAMTLRRAGLAPALLAAVGRDAEGEDLLAAAATRGLDTRFVLLSPDLPTDRYVAIEGAQGLIAAIADARSLEAAGEAILAPLADGRLATAAAPWTGLVALDGNLTPALLAQIAVSPLFARADLRLAPASPGKAERLRPFLTRPGATLYLNLTEACTLGEHAYPDAPAAALGLATRGAHRVCVTDGPRPLAAALDGRHHVLTPPEVAVRRVTGAGDTFMAAHIAAERAGLAPEAALARALATATAFVAGDPAS
jgi:sugar/nucleoside kinase (ribokinase family)